MPKIKWLMFESTSKCSLNCQHCYNIQKISSEYPKHLLSTSDTLSLLRTAIKKIKYTGGAYDPKETCKSRCSKNFG